MFGLGWLFPNTERQAAKRMRGYIDAVWKAGGPQKYVPWALHTLKRDLKGARLIQVEMLPFDQQQPRLAALMLLGEVRARYGLTGSLSTADVETLQGDDDYWVAYGLYHEVNRIVTEAELKGVQAEIHDHARAALMALVDNPNPEEPPDPIERLLSERREASDKGWISYCLSTDDLTALFGR